MYWKDLHLLKLLVCLELFLLFYYCFLFILSVSHFCFPLLAFFFGGEAVLEHLVFYSNLSIMILTVSLYSFFSSCSRDYKIHTFHYFANWNIKTLTPENSLYSALHYVRGIVLNVTPTYTEKFIRQWYTFALNHKTYFWSSQEENNSL